MMLIDEWINKEMCGEVKRWQKTDKSHHQPSSKTSHRGEEKID